MLEHIQFKKYRHKSNLTLAYSLDHTRELDSLNYFRFRLLPDGKVGIDSVKTIFLS